MTPFLMVPIEKFEAKTFVRGTNCNIAVPYSIYRGIKDRWALNIITHEDNFWKAPHDEED